MKTIFCIVAGWGLGGRAAQAQAPLEVRYAPSVVALRVDQLDEVGSGFVVGSTPDSVYIATAGHVLKSPLALVQVTLFGWAQPLPARVRFYSYGRGPDLALLAVAARAYRWVPWAMAGRLTPTDALCFIRPVVASSAAGGRCDDWQKLPGAGQGEMRQTNHQTHTVGFELAGVEGGDSGSALLVDAGEVRIVGMILQQSKTHTALSIGYIKQVLQPILGPRWQLPD